MSKDIFPGEYYNGYKGHYAFKYNSRFKTNIETKNESCEISCNRQVMSNKSD